MSGVCEGPGLAASVPARVLQTFSITAQDAQGQPRKKGGDVFRVVVDCTPAPAPGTSTAAVPAPVAVAVRDMLDGVYAVSYDGARAGTYSIAVTDSNGQPLPRSPFRVLVTAGTAASGSPVRPSSGSPSS